MEKVYYVHSLKLSCLVLLALVAVNFGSLSDLGVAAATTARSAEASPATTIDIGFGDQHICILQNEGSVLCKGDNEHQQLGVGEMFGSSDFIAPTFENGEPLSDVEQLSVGRFMSCAITSGDSLYCWGKNDYGALGVGNNDLHSYVQEVAGSWVQVSAGDDWAGIACGVKTDGYTYCWGNNDGGAIGAGSDADANNGTSVLEPTRVEFDPTGPTPGPLENVLSVVAGDGLSCAITLDGAAYCWGFGSKGSLGRGSTDCCSVNNSPMPVLAAANTPLTGVVSIAPHGYGACALLGSSQVVCWGDASSGQLGNGEATDSGYAQAVLDGSGGEPLTGVTDLSATCALMGDDTLRCWGAHPSNGSLFSSGYPVTVQTRNGVLTDISYLPGQTGNKRSCATTATGAVYCGYVNYWRLGISANTGYAELIPLFGSSQTDVGDDSGGGSSLALSASLIGVSCDRSELHPFGDISAGSFAADAVGCLAALGVTTGTSASTYSPSATITREQMAAFIARFYRVTTGLECSSPAPFDDVPLSSYAYADIGCIASLGITFGTSVDEYSPAGSVTREQMAAFLARLYRTISGADCTISSPFDDVRLSSYAYVDIGCIASLGITTGTSVDEYSPADSVTREQMAAFLARVYRVLV